MPCDSFSSTLAENSASLRLRFRLEASYLVTYPELIMSSSEARTGRHRQRYEDGLRLVSGCIPYRLVQNCEVLMISSPGRDDLVFPKGGWEDDETIDEAACREAFEEAGVRGILGENPLGDWKFKSKSTQKSCSLEGGCRGYMFALEVTEELDSWPEQANHDRKWLTIDEAFKFCRYDWMRDALRRFLATLSEGSWMRDALVPDAGEERQTSSLAALISLLESNTEFLW